MTETEKEFKKRVTKIYTDWVNRVSDDLEFKTHFTMEEVCQKWSQIAWEEVNK